MLLPEKGSKEVTWSSELRCEGAFRIWKGVAQTQVCTEEPGSSVWVIVWYGIYKYTRNDFKAFFAQVQITCCSIFEDLSRQVAPCIHFSSLFILVCCVTLLVQRLNSLRDLDENRCQIFIRCQSTVRCQLTLRRYIGQRSMHKGYLFIHGQGFPNAKLQQDQILSSLLSSFCYSCLDSLSDRQNVIQ